MTWKRFAYICRKVSAEYNDQESISSYLSRVDNEESSQLYGAPPGKHSLSRKILDQIGSLDNKDDALTALNIYQGLNLAEKFDEPMQFKRVVAYLSYVAFIFYIVVAVYQLMVAPAFLGAFENFNLSAPGYLGWYQDYWGYFVLVVSILLIFSLVIGHYLRKIFRFELGIENSFILKYMVFRSIRKSYLKVIDILQFPVLRAGEANSHSTSTIVEHLKNIEDSNMNVAVEIQELLQIEMRFLLEKCEWQMKCISILVAVVLIFAIFFFLVSAYSPIFVLGETI